jgi:hypothetical protein
MHLAHFYLVPNVIFHYIAPDVRERTQRTKNDAYSVRKRSRSHGDGGFRSRACPERLHRGHDDGYDAIYDDCGATHYGLVVNDFSSFTASSINDRPKDLIR